MVGRQEEAAIELEETLEGLRETGEYLWESEILRLKGETLLADPSTDLERAEAIFQEALSCAREQGAKMFELRAAIRLAELWRDQDRHDDAKNLLSPIYGWFEEGLSTADLQRAKALLGRLT